MLSNGFNSFGPTACPAFGQRCVQGLLPGRPPPAAAAAVLVFALLESKMSQPRNFLGGQTLSALVGITTR